MNQTAINTAIPSPIVRKLRLVRQRKIWIHVASAIVAALAVLLAAMGVAMLIDWLATLYDSRWRVVLTVAALSAAVATVLGWLVVARRRIVGLDHIAGDVDRQIPQLQERWTTMTRLRNDAAHPEVIHPAMLRRVATEAVSWEPHVAPDQVVPVSILMRTMVGLTTVTAVLAIAVVLNSHQTLVLMQRFWLPSSSISATELVDLPGDIVIGRGEPLELTAAVQGTPVDRAALFLRSESDPSRTISMVAHGNDPIAFSHRLRAVEKPFEYRFRAGDGQTEWYSVDVAERPEIEKLTLTVTPPEYTHRETTTFDKLPQRVAAIQDSKLDLALRSKRAVDSVRLRMGNERHVTLLADGDGWYRWSTTLEEGFDFSPILTESHGLTNRHAPKCHVSVYPDQPPAVKILAPDDQMAVRPDDTVQITFAASDDVGIGSAELLVYDESVAGDQEKPIAAIPIELGDDQGARAVQQSVNLDLSKFLVDDGAEVSYEVRVRENRGGAKTQAAGENSATASVNSPTSTPSEPVTSQTAAAPSEGETPQRSVPRQGEPDSAAAKMAKQTAPRPSETAATERAKSSPPTSSFAANRPQNRDSTQTGQSSTPQSNAAQPQTKPPAEPQTKPPAKPKSDTASNQPARKATDDPGAARTATSGRKGLTADQMADKKQGPGTKPDANASNDASTKVASNSPTSPSAESQPRNSRQPANDASQQAKNAQSPASSQSASSGSNSPQDSQPQSDSMPKRSLDVAQTASSKRMRLKIDELAGSFSGQQRAKLEMAIAPELAALDQALAKGQRTARGVLDQLEADGKWRATHEHEVSSAERSTVEAQEVISKLQQRSKDTPYAFIGLQVADIGLAHVDPARSSFWKALQSDGDDRAGSVRDGWQHLGRARELVAELRGQFERARREFQLAESVERVKKMYQVYIENTHTLLQIQDSDPDRYNRKMAEFNLDDEYLARLKEVLEMRRDLQAELARILGEDPRLLRRFMDSVRNRTNNLREELAVLVAEQNDLNREVQAWTQVEEANRPQMARLLALRQAQDAAEISKAAGELQDRYQAWLPLDRESKDADLANATKMIQTVATTANELSTAAAQCIAESQRVKLATPTTAPEGATAESPATDTTATEAAAAESLEPMIAIGQRLYEQLGGLEVALRQLAAREEGAEAALFAANRLVDTRRLITDTSAWVRQMRAHNAGNYTGAAEVDQYRLAMKTDALAGKLGTIEQSLSGAMQRGDGTLPEPIAQKAREFITALDREASPSQLAAVYALHSNQLPRATARQQAAGNALAKAEKHYDELMRLTIEELDKLPVQDPIADLLDDPTLDELLAQLEQESPIAELLGIPNRPSNLRIIFDWLRPGGGGGGGLFVMNQMRLDQQRMRQQLQRAYQRAIARALKEEKDRRRIEIPRTQMSDWNRLVSRLGEDLRQGRDKAPPEQYRRAIEQYFDQISRAVAEEEKKAP